MRTALAKLLDVNKALHGRVEPVVQRGRKAEGLWYRCLEGCTVNYAPSGVARSRRLATEFDCLIELGECAPCPYLTRTILRTWATGPACNRYKYTPLATRWPR